MKKIAFILLLLMGTTALGYAQDIDEYYTKEISTRGIKQITEKSLRGWKTVRHYDEQGYLRLIEHFKRGRKRSEEAYDYTITDSLLLEVRTLSGQKNDSTVRCIDKYFYDEQGRCRRQERRLMGSGKSVWFMAIEDSFVYNGPQLMAYTRYLSTGKGEERFVYTYDAQGRKTMMKSIYPDGNTTYHQFKYNDKGHLTDYIRESSDPNDWFSCVPLWSESKQNKVHERYCNFDKHGNWTKHYFITERSKVLWSKRKLVYWH